MHLRSASVVSGLLVLTIAGQALALDAWRDRRGLLFGLGVGGGIGQAHVDGGDSESEVGFNFRARVGGGLNEKVTLDFDFGMHFQNEEREVLGGSVDLSTRLTSGMVAANYFVYDGLYVRGMGGMGHIKSEAEGKGGGGASASEAGLGVGFGAGYEFFANSDLAIGGGADYRYFFFDDAEFSLVGFGITATWY
jgi:hypothetical protein